MIQHHTDTTRSLVAADVPVVARLFQKILRKTREPATPALETYLASVFLDGPDRDPEINSFVHLRRDGCVNGFVGVLPLPLLVGDRPVRGALCGTLMVEDHADDPFAGARLMRAFLGGPQDVSLTETANDISTTMWRKLRATVLPDHSLEWLRVIRPAGFAAEMAARAVGLGGVLRPLARPVDALVRRGGDGPSWTHMPVGLPAGTLASAEVDDGEAAALFVELTGGYEVRPNWRAQSLARMLAESRRKAVYGAMVRRKVVARNGRPVGLFLYYGDPGRVGRVVQVLHAPGQAGIVLDSMLAHAGETGLVALRGRTMPALLEAMLGRRFMFVHASSSIVHARDKSLIEPFVAGRAFFNGFAGESWSRLIGDRFD
ncbi:hypothetical protein [Nitratireductor sp. StC3]|uniref:hypothetical protein n=1 Tax=Nitratireductor sp. StC3 TaxID=2126741 RepID=UPI000D0D5F3B|nr:hypothetical protein [Nitratireductor sp. StC3]PSM16718.1 hypothetical protein C7T96_18765 [Nitratireductor sp. StC3]